MKYIPKPEVELSGFLPRCNEILYVADLAQNLFPDVPESRQRALLKPVWRDFSQIAPYHVWIESAVDAYSLAQLRLGSMIAEASGSAIIGKQHVKAYPGFLRISGNIRIWDEFLTADTPSDVYVGVDLLNAIVPAYKGNNFRFLVQGLERMILAHCILHRTLTSEFATMDSLAADLTSLWRGVSKSVSRGRLNDRRYRLLRTIAKTTPTHLSESRLLLGIGSEL